MNTLTLLFLIMACYAGYNLLIKLSGEVAGPSVSPLLATISLQIAALTVSLVYLVYLWRSQVAIILPAKAYPWAVAAGVCIGLAEILYFYLFRETDAGKSVAASVAIPIIVGGTIVVVTCVSFWLFGERLSLVQWGGLGLAMVGLVLLATG